MELEKKKAEELKMIERLEQQGRNKTDDLTKRIETIINLKKEIVVNSN